MIRPMRVREVLADFVRKMHTWRGRPPEVREQLARVVLELTKLNNLVNGLEKERRTKVVEREDPRQQEL
jgi:hypothetical protein